MGDSSISVGTSRGIGRWNLVSRLQELTERLGVPYQQFRKMFILFNLGLQEPLVKIHSMGRFLNAQKNLVGPIC